MPSCLKCGARCRRKQGRTRCRRCGPSDVPPPLPPLTVSYGEFYSKVPPQTTRDLFVVPPLDLKERRDDSP